MNKFFGRMGAALIALCLVVSLVPSISYAADNDAVTIDFTSADITLGSKNGVTPVVVQTTPSQVAGVGFTTIAAETTTKSGRLSARNFKSDGSKTMYIDTNATPWLSTGGDREKWTISVELGTTTPGWYDISLIGGKWYAAGAWYIYVNDQYAGYYDCYQSKTTGMPEVDSSTTKLNALYLTPDANGNVKVMFALAKTYEGYARLILNSMTFTPSSEPDLAKAQIESAVTIPENVTVGTEIPFSASVKMEDGSTRYINGIKADKSADANNNIGVSLKSGSGIEVCDGYLKSVCAGPVKFVVAAKINGVAIESEEYEFTSTITEPQTMVLDFTQRIITAADAKAAPSKWIVAPNAGYEILFNKSTDSASCQFNHDPIGGVGFVKIWTNSSEWPLGTNVGVGSMFTIKKYIGAAGWYSVAFEGIKWYASSHYAIYVDGEYAGDYNFCDSNERNPAKVVKENMNTIYLDEGYAEISFRLRRKLYSGGSLFMPWQLTLTPTTAPVVSAVESELPAEMDKGESIDLTARALMSDNTYRSFGYTDAGAVSASDIINVTSSNSNIVSVESLKQINEDPTTTEFTLSAKNSGTADITVTALIDNQPTTKKVTVSVPYTDDSVAAQKNVSYVIRGSKAEFNAGIDMENYNAGNIGSQPLNKSLTVKAKEEITIGDTKYNFAYWQTSGGIPIEDAAAEYTFAPKSNFVLEAVYIAENAENVAKKVQFYNFNRAFISESGVKDDGTVDAMPETPSLAGHTFTGWTAGNIGAFGADTQLFASLTHVVAQFDAEKNAYSVKVNGNLEGKYTYGDLFETTADDTRGTQVFSHWEIGGKTVSYNKNISLYVWNDVELSAVYAESAIAPVPTVVLDSIGDEYFIAYEVPQGYTPIDAGIVFGSNNPRVDSTDGSKASVKAVKTKGQFTAMPNANAAYDEALGYVMYKVDATGENRVIYSK